MFAKVTSAHIIGIDAIKVDVEVDIGNSGLPSYNMVGLAEGAVKESKDRVRSALRNMGYNIFAKPITINLAPANIRKDGSHYDLAIAIALLMANEPEKYDIKNTMVVGELSLDGTIRGVNGILCMCAWAKDNGIDSVIIPTENLIEASLIKGMKIYAFSNLTEITSFMTDKNNYKAPKVLKSEENISNTIDFIDVKGQSMARRVAEIAAAGMHNLIMIGSPGSGKTMIAKRMPTILPPMTQEEALLTTKIHSVAGILKQQNNLMNTRPFIAPHHTASNIAIIGGGKNAMPGHVSIATNGILFLDEMLEFNKTVLEVLRQPMEDREVIIARAGKTVKYPASFMLIGACNPCPCGYYKDTKQSCVCTMQEISRYRNKLSGPLYDRIDLHIHMHAMTFSEISTNKQSESSEAIRKRVIAAHRVQKERFRNSDIVFNSQMSEKDVSRFCKVDKQGIAVLENATNKFGLTARSYNKILKCARTIADLSNKEDITSIEIAEALQYRIVENQR